MKDQQFKIFGEYSEIKSAYEGNSLEKIAGLYRSQYRVIKMCEYYSDSRYLGSHLGNKKTFGDYSLDIPFSNVVNYRVALAKTATDLNIRDINIISDNPKHQVHSMLLNREAYEWMKESEFSSVLNEMGQTCPKYGGYLIKKCYNEDDELSIEVVRWTNVITDQNDILGGPIIEKHEMSPVGLKKKDGTWENINDVLRAFRKIKASERPSTIEVREITGEFPIAIYKDSVGETASEDDQFEYSLQHYFIANVGDIKFLLYSEELKGKMEDYYEYRTWEDNGYGLGRGVIEDCEEAQVWTNDAVINEHLAMMIAGRVGIKTSSKKLGNNILQHDHGKIYELEKDADINAFNLAPSALGQYQNIIERWRQQGDNVASSYNATTGEQPPANTPYSQTALLNQVATKPFDYKRQEWGIHLTKVFEKWVIPYLVKDIYKEHILVSDFSDTELEMIDESFANYNANKDIIKEVLKGNIVSPIQQQDLTEAYKKHIKKDGKKRFLEVPEGYFDDVLPKVSVITTGEQKNKAAVAQAISELMKTVISTFNPTTGEFGALKDPTLSKLFNEVIELSGTGISPVSIGKGASPTQAPPSPSPAPSVPSPAQASPALSAPNQ